MPAKKVETFGGMIPIVDDRLLQDSNASYAQNVLVIHGRCEPFAASINVHTLVDPLSQYAFRVPIGPAGVEHMPDSYWLEFRNANTQVVRSPVTGETDPRFYWA